MNTKQKGSALPIVLIMMLVLTVLGVAGLKMAQAQYKMVGAEQFYAVALQTAESAINSHLALTELRDGPINELTEGTLITLSGSSATPRHWYKGDGPVPGGGYSTANSTFRAYHFELQATATAPANTSATLVEGVYLVARGGN